MSSVKIIDLENLKNQYNLTIAVETGSGGGGGTNILYKKFHKVFTCEIDREQYEKDSKRFENIKDISVYNLSSKDFLIKILPEVENERILFWLDAHFPQKFNDISEVVPLYEELKIITSLRDCSSDVLLIDDFRVFLMMDIYRGNNVKDYVKLIYNDHNMSVDIPTKEEILDLFPKHNSEVIERNEWILILTPRGDN